MIPSFPQNNAADYSLRNIVFLGKLHLICLIACVFSADFADISINEFCRAVPLSFSVFSSPERCQRASAFGMRDATAQTTYFTLAEIEYGTQFGLSKLTAGVKVTHL